MMLKQISLYPFVSTIATNNKIVSCLTMFTHILICSYICLTFKYLVEPKKMRLATKRRSVQFPALELRSETIS